VTPYVEMQGITKLYREMGVLANAGVDFSVEKGEIHALVGENGAGKSTLMKILYGLEHPDEGTIAINGNVVSITSPLEANRLGIGMVHQHFKLIGDFTVAENVVLGNEPKHFGIFIDREKAVERVGKVIADHNFHIDPAQRVSRLTVGQMQQVEIIKMLYRNVDLLILDEPTSVLTEQEIARLFDTLTYLLSIGKTVIMITHKLGEVMEISSRVTVMRKGKRVAVVKTAETDRKELARLMVDKSVLFQIEKEKIACGEPVLELSDITLLPRGRTVPLLNRVSFAVRTCESGGVAGVGGNGLGELEDVVSGLRKVSSGKLFHDGDEITNLGAEELRSRGLAYVPADRLHRGSSLTTTVKENMIISGHHSFLSRGVFKRKMVEDFARTLREKYTIDGDPDAPIGTLSGGNIQKVILARELDAKTDFIIFSEPTWGLDVASSQFIYEKILEMRKAGAGVLLISSNIDEILALADRVIVMYKGRIVTDRPCDEKLTKELIGEYMLGLKDDFAAGTAETADSGKGKSRG